MIEYHGWLTLRESPSEIDERGLRAIYEGLKQKLSDSAFFSVVIDLKYINGNCQLWISGNANHRSQEFEDVLALLEEIASKATGTYGLLYLWDDEDPQHYNSFQVFVIRRGTVIPECDTYLSPCVPTIEDSE
jgi:hypothetical protein